MNSVPHWIVKIKFLMRDLKFFGSPGWRSRAGPAEEAVEDEVRLLAVEVCGARTNHSEEGGQREKPHQHQDEGDRPHPGRPMRQPDWS